MFLDENILNEKLVKYPTKLNSFIGGWYIPKKVCDDLLTFIDNNKEKFSEGETNTGKNLETKDSMDLTISPNHFGFPFREYRSYLQNCLQEYVKTYPDLDNNAIFNVTEKYNLQYYKKGGGFKKWHCESSMDILNYKRVLVFMTYLNDVPDGGTDFKYQKLRTQAEKGLTLIWPAHWTHTHKGVISQTSEKKIVTGWYHSVNLYDWEKTIYEKGLLDIAS
jgi:hypothetical protein